MVWREAPRWYRLAALAGEPLAMRELAELHEIGQGVLRDLVAALAQCVAQDRDWWTQL